MRKFESMLWAVVAAITWVEFHHKGSVFTLVQAAGFALFSIASFFSKATPMKASDKVTLAGFFRSADEPWINACQIIGGLLIVAGLSGAAFAR